MAPRKSRRVQQPAWRPNFRNVATLPDIKVIRTGFTINLVAISLAVLLFGLVVFREYRISVTETLVAVTQGNIEAGAAADRRSVRMSAEFDRAGRSVGEFVKFLNVPLNADDLIFALASMQPPEMILNNISFSPSVTRQGRRETVRYQILLSGTVRDAAGDVDGPRSASDIITSYRNRFGDLELLKPFFEGSELSGISRDEAQGHFNFTVRVTLSMTPKAD